MKKTTEEKIQNYFFFFLFFSSILLVALVFTPFVNSIALSLVIAVIFKPLYQRVLTELPNYPSLASLITIMFIGVILILPLSFLSAQIVNEAQNVAVTLVDADTETIIDESALEIETAVQTVLPNFELNVDDFKQKTSSFVLSSALDNWTLLKNGTITAAHTILGLILSIIILYFLFRDGKKFKKHIIHYSPLKNKDDEKIITKLEQTVNSVIRGALVIAVIQGFFSGIGLLIFGVPNPTLWGMLAGIGSLVPGVGTVIVLLPAILYLFFTSQTLAAIGLAVWGVVVVGLVDNILMPYFYSRGVQIHPVLILISVLGGLLTFGPLGFLYGPLILSLFFTLLEMYQPIVMDK